jgi:hypothetical protein
MKYAKRQYTPEEISEIIGRITTLRRRWLDTVDTKLSNQRRGNEPKPPQKFPDQSDLDAPRL